MIYLKEGKTPLNFAYNDEIIQEGNSKYQLSFKFPTNNPLWEELVEETLLLADDLHGEQEFIIFEVEKHHAYITVYANQVATLLNNYSITELSVNNASGDRVMRSLVSSIIREHKFTFSSDIANTHSLNLKNVTVANALFKDKHSIIGQWGGDLIRDKYDIRLLSNGGSNKEALFMYKKNLKSYQQKKSIKDLRTRIHFTKTINSQKEGEKDKVIAVTVDSPLINKYKNIYEGNLDVSDQDVVDEATLRKYGEQYFKTTLCDVIEESIEIDVVGIPDVPVGIFDTVTIFHEKFNLDVKKKITKYTYSPMGRKLKTIGFGKIQSNLGTTLATMVDNAIEEKAETMLDAFKIQKNLAQLLKLDRKGIEDKLVELEEKSKGALEVKKALFEADGTIPDVVKAKILDAVEGDIGRLKTIITETELIKAIQAKLNYADIKNALIDKAFINQIISDEKFTQQFEDGEVTTQNIFTKLKDSIKSNISKEFVTKDGVKKLVNDLTIDADGIRQITQQESSKVFENKKSQLKGIDSYIHKKYSDYPDGRSMSDNSTLKYIGIYTGDKQQAPTNASEYSWTKIKSDGKLYKAYSNSLNGLDFTLVEPDENAKLFAKNRPRVNIVNDNDISDIWQANMFLSFKPNTKYTLTARAKGNSNKLWAYFRNNRTNEEYSWGQLEFRGLETKSITFTTTNNVDDVLFKFVLVPEDEDWTGIQIDWFTIYEGDKRYTDYPTNEPAQYHKYRYFGYVFKEGTPVASDFEWFDLQQTSITNDKYTHIVYSDNADGSNFGREPKKYMGVARTTSPAQPTDKTAYKWFKMKGEDGERGRDGVSSYIHRKYSDYSSGYGMDDNPNRKYIGIYTGTNPTPPTTASSYLWSKIKGEDGANGVPGAKGADGRTPYFHTAYANSPTGDRDFSTTNSNDKLYIGTYSDFEVADSTDYRKYKWVKIKGENGRNGSNGRDGVSSYIYRKYSDNANGSPMSDNSNLKYIGIYTGTSATAPTTPTSYTWSKIKGEDGAQGVPGARGTDGRTSYLHTAYSNSATGDRDFSTTNSTNKEYIGTYTDFEINDSNDYRRYKWVKIKGENGRDGKSINENLLPNSNFNQGFAKWEDKLTNSGLNHSFDHANIHFGRGLHIYGTANADYKGLSSVAFNLIAKQGDKLTLSMDLGKDALTQNAPLRLALHYIDDKDVIVGQEWQTLDLATQNFEVRKYKRISRVFTVQKDIRKCRVMIYATTSQLINFYIDNIKLERGEVATEWSPAYEDLQAHTLTANLRLEGTYINGVTNNVKCYLDVFYDGRKITDGFNAQIKFKGGILNTWSNFWTAKVDNTGFLTNVSWGNKEQQYPIALDVIVLVTYKDSNTVANARMENVPDVVEIKEVVKKYKTFESTLEGFTSVVGEINTKVLTKQQIRQNLSSEDVEKTGNDLYFNAKENLQANEYYTILADLDNVPANQKAKIYGASDGGDEKLIQNGLNYWVVKYPNNRGSINLYPLGANTKVKNVRIFKGDFRVKKDDERENLYSSSATDSGDKFIHLNLIKNKINGNVYTVKFDASGYSNGDKWDVYNRIGYDENNLTQLLRAKGNELTFTINDNTTADRMYIRMKLVGNTTISNVEIYDVSTEYVKNSQVSKLESSITQTKNEIDLKVSKDNVINSINISGEGTRIKGDLIADYLYGKTIEGATLQGNSKIKIGKHGYMIPVGEGLRFCLPEKPDANKGVGIQMLGNYGRNGDTPYGFYLYVDPNFDTREVAGTDSYLMTVNGYISTRGVNNLKFQNYSDNSTSIGLWNKDVSLLFDNTDNDIYYAWKSKYSLWGIIKNFYNTTSDERLKKDIVTCDYRALDLINDFKFKSFNWKYHEEFGQKPYTEIGLIAQDVEKINKNFVTMAGEYKTLNQFNLLTYSLKAIQELSTENQQLKSQLKEMNERLTKLEDKINGNL